MHFRGLSALLLSLCVAFVCAEADTSTTTFTSTATSTHFITVSEVVASVTSTYSSYNTSVVAPTSVGTIVATGTGKIPGYTSAPSASSAVPSNFANAAPAVQAGGIGAMGLFVMAAVAML